MSRKSFAGIRRRSEIDASNLLFGGKLMDLCTESCLFRRGFHSETRPIVGTTDICSTWNTSHFDPRFQIVPRGTCPRSTIRPTFPRSKNLVKTLRQLSFAQFQTVLTFTRISIPANTAPLTNPFLDDPVYISDEELVSRAKSDDRNQLEPLLIHHSLRLFNLSTRMLHRRADVEDATQEILLKTINALPGFRGEADFRTWLYRIAVNHLLSARKPKWDACDAICSFAQASAGLRPIPDLDPPESRTVPTNGDRESRNRE
jgi:hypothetical protein